MGNYSNRLFTGTGANDRIDYVLPNGTQGTFSTLPNSGSNWEGTAFAPDSSYGGLMYTGLYSGTAGNLSGVYSIDTSGGNVNMISRITPVPEPASVLLFSIGACLFQKRKNKDKLKAKAFI